MSARNYLSAREKRFDCLPSIPQKLCKGPELPPLSATAGRYNRNVYSYEAQLYKQHTNSLERATTPFSDFLSESETGTPDLNSEESDSSAGSALRRSNAEATRTLAEEWERIERTLYGEEGEKTTRPQIIEECKQWRALHPQLRIVGRALQLPEKRPGGRPADYDEVVIMNYSDYSQFSESDERLSQSSTDVTPENSPRETIHDMNCEPVMVKEKQFDETYEPRLSREKIATYHSYEGERELPETFHSLLHITPLHIRTPSHRKRQNPSILKSDIASSRWMKNSRPDSSTNCDRNSAKSFVSLDTRKYGNVALSASDCNKMLSSRVLTARHRDIARLEPLYTPDLPPSEMCRSNGFPYAYSMRKVSLPPLLLEEEKKKVVHSAKKQNKPRKNVPKNSHHLERVRCNK